jgi:hypothetical protein
MEHNIVINDLDQFGYELWDYQAKSASGESYPLYYFYDKTDSNKVVNITANGDMIVDGIKLKNIKKE